MQTKAFAWIKNECDERAKIRPAVKFIKKISFHNWASKSRRSVADRKSLSNARGTRYPVPVWSVAPQRTIPLKTARDRESCPRKSIWRGNSLRVSLFQRAPGRPGRPASLSRAGHETPPCDQGGDSPLDSSRAAPRGKPRGAARDIRSGSLRFLKAERRMILGSI